jgi:hypothetical protein
MTALPDLKQLMGQQKVKALAIQTMAKPPVTAPVELKTQATSLIPGGVTYVNDLTGGKGGLRSVYDVRIDISHLVEDVRQTQGQIQRAFYEDLFLMLAQSDGSSQPITAEEVRERHEEKLLALGPVLERTNDELLEPLIDRVWQMMEAAHLIPVAPHELEGVTIKAEYTSIMAQAQKLVGVVGLDRFVSTISNLIVTGVAPAIRHKVDFNRIADVYADAIGIEPSIMRTDADAQQLADAEQQAAQRAAEAQQAQQMAAAVKSAGTTPMGGDTALTRLVGSGAAGPGVPGAVPGGMAA